MENQLVIFLFPGTLKTQQTNRQRHTIINMCVDCYIELTNYLNYYWS